MDVKVSPHGGKKSKKHPVYPTPYTIDSGSWDTPSSSTQETSKYGTGAKLDDDFFGAYGSGYDGVTA